MRPRAMPRVGMNFEYLMWIFIRVSGLAMVILGLIGLVMAFVYHARTGMDMVTLLRWTFFPNSYHIQDANVEVINVDLFTLETWRILQLVIIFFAGTHGINGIRNILEDYIGASLLKLLLRTFLFAVWLFMIILAVQLIYST